jgi:hypothetical protein
MSPGTADGLRWFWANTRTEACPSGFNTEETIKELWGGLEQPKALTPP